VSLDVNADGVSDLIDVDVLRGDIYLRDGATGAFLWPGNDGAKSGVRRVGREDVFEVLEAGGFRAMSTGELVDTVPSHHLHPFSVAVSDLNGQGQAALILGSRDGALHAMELDTGSVLWRLRLDVGIRHIIAANLSGDDALELLVSAEDGRLYAIGQVAPLGQISEAFDGIERDVDLATPETPGFGPSLVTASWTEAQGGTEPILGHLMRLVTDTGAVVVDWQAVGPETQATLVLPAPMVPGVKYRTIIAPYGQSGTGRFISTDGFRLAQTLFDVRPERPERQGDADHLDAMDTPDDGGDHAGVEVGQGVVVAEPAPTEARSRRGCAVSEPEGKRSAHWPWALQLCLIYLIVRARRARNSV
jgi:hypothetical protein